ncbi:MAG: hypothetical protein IJV01_06415 [Bacteroidales bacterium]|nr:hypothetical protein [Bacteroidales bacterium]
MKHLAMVLVALTAAAFAASAQEISREQLVDLGLSVKWSGWNLGANAPEELGGLYAWGELEEKEVYDLSTYKWCKGSYRTMTKYCTDEQWGVNDGKTELDPEDDVVRVKWGGKWRMPTNAEMDELLVKAKWTGTVYKGVNGFKVVGPNGKAIFFPFAGDRYNKKLDLVNMAGIYWTSSIDRISPYTTAGMYILSGRTNRGIGLLREFGHSIRPVSD